MSRSRLIARCLLLGLAISGLSPRAPAAAGIYEDAPDGVELAVASDAAAETLWAAESDTLPTQPSAAWAPDVTARWFHPVPQRGWTLDYRVRSMFNSRTCYEFGQPPTEPVVYAPLSRLDWSLDSLWQGFQIGRREANWGLQFEWLTPTERSVNGSLFDYDWMDEADPHHLASLSQSALRWNDGQTLDLGGEFRLRDCTLLGMPVQVWPMAGFRFQRFAMTAHDGLQLIGENPTVPPAGTLLPGDLIVFNQQYYVLYLGGQLRGALGLAPLPPIALTFQGDWGATFGYNVDHHLFYEQFGVHRYTMEKTRGDAVHFSLAAEAPLTRRLSLGVQFDYTRIRTTGTHRWLTYDDYGNRQDQSWDNGVKVASDQESLTAFLRFNF